MFSGFSDDTIHFFLDIRFHNDVSFMADHRAEYVRAVQAPFYAFIEEIAPAMLKIDPDFETRPSKCLARIHRDTRFTKDKSPYRDHLWLAFRKAAVPKDGMPFFWFELGADFLNWGVGVWGENRAASDILRRRIAAHPADYGGLIALAQKSGFAMGGPEFKRFPVPPGLTPELKSMYLKKEIFFEKQGVKFEWAFSPDIVSRVTRDFKKLAPVYQMLCGLADEAAEAL